MTTNIRTALIAAAVVLVGGSAAVANARTQLAGTGYSKAIGTYTCVHDSIGRIDNNCTVASGTNIDWIIPLTNDTTGYYAPTFVGAGDGNVNNLNQTRCNPYWIGTDAVYHYSTAGYVAVNYSTTPSTATMHALSVASGGAVGVECLIPPTGRLISVSYVP
jgi:hypothetical protein